VSLRWEDLDARARGLATHLLSRAELDALGRLPDVAALGDALRRHDYPVEEREVSPATLELAVRRMAAARLRLMARWCGPRTGVLAVVFEDEDRRSLRALLRGAIQRVPAEARLAGLLPTPELPERALQELSHQPTPAALATLLTVWRNPYGAALAGAAAAAQPDPFTLEVLVNRTFATRAGRAARGRGLLERYVRETIDVENAYAALALAGAEKDVKPKDAFLSGGARISIAEFETAAAAGESGAAAQRLAAAFQGTPLEPPFARWRDDPAVLERAVLRVRIRGLVRAMRTEPLGPAPVLAYLLRLRTEVIDLQGIIWGISLGAPHVALARDLVAV
jgi:vacuolar-type H+-ATPase subunit C/Vma6